MASASGHGSMSFRGNTSLNSSLNMSISGSLNQSRTRTGRIGSTEVSIYTSDQHFFFDPYGSQLPSMVKVALTVGNTDVQNISCRLDPNGWAWLVCQRKLYIWKYSYGSDQNKKTSIACRELTLPPSELVHSANLICIVSNANSSNPSCIAVNPEGHITYWPNIANGSSTVSVNADIPGQECDSLTSVWPTGCMLTTTSCTVLLVKPVSAAGNKPSLTCVPLGLQKGWLGGLKKMTQHMLFTPLPAVSSALETKRAKVVVPLTKDDDPNNPGKNREGRVYIFCGATFQTWQISPQGSNYLSEVNLHDTVKLQFYNNVWATEEESKADVRGIQVWILDVAAMPQTKQVALFAAAKGQFESSDNLVYGLIVLDVKNPTREDSITFLKVDKITGTPNEDHLFVWKLLCTPDYFVMISNDLVVIASDSDDEGVSDSIDAGSFGQIIGQGLLNPAVALLFSSKYGIFSVKTAGLANQSLFGLDETFNEVRVPDHLALSITQSNVSDTSATEEVNRYKSAMINFVNRKVDDAVNILAGLFPPNVPSLAPHDPLDKATVALCEKLVDDAPISDPRWMSNFGRHADQDPMGMKSKILIKNFLTDKKEGLELFFHFLNGAKLWPRLRGVIIKEDIIATGSILYNCYEKIGFALALQTLQTETQHRKLVDTAIKSIVFMRSKTEPEVKGSFLSHNDLFYKDISRIHHIIPALVSIEEEDLSQMSPKEMAARIYQTNEILLRTYFEATTVFLGEKLNSVRAFLLQPLLDTPGNEYEIAPWLVQGSVLPHLLKQHQLVVSSGIPHTDADFGMRIDLIKQMVQLSDLILDGMKVNAESVHQSERYRHKFMNFEKIRGKLLRAHLEVQDYDGAASLAEKYLDFEILVTICYEKKTTSQLEQYFSKYESMGFPEFTFEWYVKQQKTAELINTFSQSKFAGKLGEFVKKYPQLAWHHAAVTENFKDASEILDGLADVEEASADDKKFFLCMSKLAYLSQNAFEDEEHQSSFMFKVNKSLNLMDYQDELSDEILKTFGLNRNTMRVLSASDLIDMYTSADVECDVHNYWRAKELTDFMPNDAVKKEKLLLILSRLIQRDPWSTWPTDHPIDSVQTSQLYHFLELGLQRGEPLDSLFPLADLVSVDELRPLFDNAGITFLLRACYEHLSTLTFPIAGEPIEVDE